MDAAESYLNFPQSSLGLELLGDPRALQHPTTNRHEISGSALSMEIERWVEVNLLRNFRLP